PAGGRRESEQPPQRHRFCGAFFRQCHWAGAQLLLAPLHKFLMSTIGHSTLPIDVFLKILKDNGVEWLVDIRTIPKSRYNPQFAQENLEESLKAAHILYRWQKSLGGLRH